MPLSDSGGRCWRSSLGAGDAFDGPAIVCCYTTCQPEHGVADNMADIPRHDPNQELMAQGVALRHGQVAGHPDVYAVGAVLYSMIENTFPAHGGLSCVRRGHRVSMW